LLVFTDTLWAARTSGLAKYMCLSSSFLTEFETKWTDTGLPSDQCFLERPDLSALTDLGSTVAVVNSMRWMSGG
jgi:hypothetical protein